MQFFFQQQKLPIKSSAKVHAKGGVRNSMAKADKYFSELSPEQVSLSCDHDIFSSDGSTQLFRSINCTRSTNMTSKCSVMSTRALWSWPS